MAAAEVWARWLPKRNLFRTPTCQLYTIHSKSQWKFKITIELTFMDNIKTWKNTAKRMIDFLPVTWICCFYSAHSNPAGCLRFFWWFCCNLCIDSVVLYTYPVISTLTQLGLAGNQQQLRTTSTSSARCKVIPIACWAFLWRTPLSRSRRNGWRTLPRATKIGWHGEQKTLKVAKFIYI